MFYRGQLRSGYLTGALLKMAIKISENTMRGFDSDEESQTEGMDNNFKSTDDGFNSNQDNNE